MISFWWSSETRTKCPSRTSCVCPPRCSMNASQSGSHDPQTTHVVQGAPGTCLKLALTLRHLASGSKYSTMKYGWMVPHNTQSFAVREVCQAIIDEYMPEVMTCPTTPEGWRAISGKFLQRWNFPHTCSAIDGKHIACKCPPKSGSQYSNYKGFYSVVLLALVDVDYKFIWADLGSTESA